MYGEVVPDFMDIPVVPPVGVDGHAGDHDDPIQLVDGRLELRAHAPANPLVLLRCRADLYWQQRDSGFPGCQPGCRRGRRRLESAAALEGKPHTNGGKQGDGSGDANPVAGGASRLGRRHMAHAGCAMAMTWHGCRLTKRRRFVPPRLTYTKAADGLVDELVCLALVKGVECNVLNASQLVLHRLRNLALFEIYR